MPRGARHRDLLPLPHHSDTPRRGPDPAPRPGGRPRPPPDRRRPCTSLQSVSSTDWASIASLATAAGTLVLAVATFAAVRSTNRAARAAEQSLLVGLRPLFAPSRF